MHITRAVFTISLCASAGCDSEASDAGRNDSAGRRDSVAGVAAASLTEPSVLGLLALTHAADSAVGALGAAKGTATEVREFGRMILREHHALRREGAALAGQLGLVLEAPAVPPDEAPPSIRDTLASAAPGAAWDRLYVAYAIAMHEAALENCARALAATQRPETKQLIERSIPIIQKHLDKARSLAARSQTAPAATPRR